LASWITDDSYDAVGNRTQMTSTLNAVPGGTFSYDANDHLTTDGYDANGNTISSGGLSYTFDFENRLAGSGGLSMVYDGDGNRVNETVGGTTTKYLVDTLNPTGLPQVLDEVVGGSVMRTYAYGLTRVSENQLISGTWTPSFYGYDGHSNVRFLTNMAGAVTDTYQYDAFGNQISSSGSTPNSYFYSGERLDSSLGMYDLRARYYRQSTGRFWTRDPIEGRHSYTQTRVFIYLNKLERQIAFADCLEAVLLSLGLQDYSLLEIEQLQVAILRCAPLLEGWPPGIPGLPIPLN
jgi:RHS repeat-associated protein